MEPYYQNDAVQIFHGDCREILPTLGEFDLLLTDPPYGIGYKSGRDGDLPRSIAGDETTELRDFAINTSPDAAVFATWRCEPPKKPRHQLIWEKPTLGMGDLSFPFGTNYEVVWLFGDCWKSKRRQGSVIRGKAIPTWNSGPAKRRHPHEKPVDLMSQIIGSHPAETILDPFMGSGTTLVAAQLEGRKAVGIEIEEKYCAIAAERCRQKVLF